MTPCDRIDWSVRFLCVCTLFVSLSVFVSLHCSFSNLGLSLHAFLRLTVFLPGDSCVCVHLICACSEVNPYLAKEHTGVIWNRRDVWKAHFQSARGRTAEIGLKSFMLGQLFKSFTPPESENTIELKVVEMLV